MNYRIYMEGNDSPKRNDSPVDYGRVMSSFDNTGKDLIQYNASSEIKYSK